MKSALERNGRNVLLQRVAFHGHPAVLSEHPTTIEVTTDEHLTENGDCIVGVGAEVGCSGLRPELKEAIRITGSVIEVTLIVGEERFVISARGDPGLELTNPHDIVIRKSGFLSDRTLAIGADAAAKDMPRSMVEKLKDPRAAGVLEIRVS